MTIGKIGEFKLETDNWRLYAERLEQYFLVNDIKDSLKVPTLITVIGAECYELLVNLCTPKKPNEKTFQELTDILEKHLQPKPSVLAERYKFRNRKQQTGESIANFIASLKKMSTTCEFKANLEENLRDQFVCNVTSETIRQRLFAEDELDFNKAVRLAISLEAAEKDAAAVIQGQVEVNAMAGVARNTAGGGRSRSARGRGGAGYGSGRRGPAASGTGGRAPPPIGERPRDQGTCQACGGPHDGAKCRFARYVCRVCNKQGHLRRMCPNIAEQHSVQCAEAPNGSEEDSDEVKTVDINTLTVTQCKPIFITVNLEGHDVKMECDTGSAISCISYELYREKLNNLVMEPSNLTLRYYTGETVHPMGVVKPLVRYKDKEVKLDLYVIQNGKTLLLGRQWLAELKVEIPMLYRETVNHVHGEFNIDMFSSRYCKVFADGLGRFTGGTVSIHVREGARPVFLRARPLAYALREPVERALDQLVRDDILVPVERSEWATPIVPVVKKDGTIRICADYKLTLNKVLEVDRYPLPKVEDLLARLHGGERFSKIDLSQAYAQFELDESRKFTVINTHKGLFMYKRLVYGLASSPAIFQRRLEQLFADLPYVGVFLDDVIITGQNNQQHLENLHKVFQRLEAHGLKVKKNKCNFFAHTIEYLGHVISKEGVHTCPNKVKAIRNFPCPSNISELRAFLGMVMYYGKFIKNVSTMLAPLYSLLRAGVKYEWGKDCQVAFEDVKRALSSGEVLTHYSPNQPLVLTSDASSVGIGAVISHITPDGERPIAYASRTLSAAERAYAQIDREALAIVYGVRKFHQYLYGRKFTLRTDHKPLTYIYGDKVGIPVMAASRIQRWAILLSGYNYEIEYVTSARNCADALSRLPQLPPVGKQHQQEVGEVTYLNFVEDFLPITNKEVREGTAKDSVLSKVITYLQSGWPSVVDDERVKPYYTRRHELYLERGCVMWGYRMVVPVGLRNRILKQLHISHMGIVKTKSMARSYVWWPGIDSNVEDTCKQCETCAMEAQAPPRAPPQPWPYNTLPWSRLHVDFLGPFNNKKFFVIVDSSTKWIEIFEMQNTSAKEVIKVLRGLFARFGLPTEMVSDQGPPFTSEELGGFLKNNGIRQSFSPAYHPSSNGAAENAVKLCKRAIKKATRDGIDIDAALQTFLLAYRNSIHSSTGESPAMLLQRRSLRCRLDLLRSGDALEWSVRAAQQRQVRNASGGSQPRQLQPGDSVWARQYNAGDKWVEGTVVSNDGSRRYSICSKDNGRLVGRHIDQIRRRSSNIYPDTGTDGVVRKEENGDVLGSPGRQSEMDEDTNRGTGSVEECILSPIMGSSTQSPSVSRSSPTPPPAENIGTPVKRSERIRKPPVRYGFEFD